MANGLALIVWVVSFRLAPGMPFVVEEMVFPADIGCQEFCNDFDRQAHAWLRTQRLKGSPSCGCSTEGKQYVGEKLKSNLRGEKVYQ